MLYAFLTLYSFAAAHAIVDIYDMFFGPGDDGIDPIDDIPAQTPTLGMKPANQKKRSIS
jgi:hypothetical protein